MMDSVLETLAGVLTQFPPLDKHSDTHLWQRVSLVDLDVLRWGLFIHVILQYIITELYLYL